MYKIRLKSGHEFGPAEMDLVIQWGREGRVPVDALLVSEADGSVQSVLAVPALAQVIQAPPTVVSGVTRPEDEQDGPALIPTRNPHALVGYYLGYLALLPLIGLLVVPAPLILGIMGLRKVNQNPKIKGTAHAIVAIILAAIGLIGNGFCLTGLIMQGI